MKIRQKIHVIDTDELRRATLARLAFAANLHAEIYENFVEFFKHGPDSGIAFVHDDVPPFSAIDFINGLDEANLWLPVVAISQNPEIDRIVSAIKSGAFHYMETPKSITVLNKIVDDVALQFEVFLENRTRASSARRLIDRLSSREREVLDRLALGLSNKSIGRDLDISPRTVEIHRTNLMRKIGARHVADAVRVRIEAGYHIAA